MSDHGNYIVEDLRPRRETGRWKVLGVFGEDDGPVFATRAEAEAEAMRRRAEQRAEEDKDLTAYRQDGAYIEPETEIDPDPNAKPRQSMFELLKQEMRKYSSLRDELIRKHSGTKPADPSQERR